MKTNLAGVWLFLGLMWGTTTCPGATALPTETSALFAASGNCTFCHDRWGPALANARGESVSITDDWRGTMMAHSFQDPLWRAVMEAEVAAHPDQAAALEDACHTCHAPMARTQRNHDHQGTLRFADARKSDLAGDGVSCTLCHQIQPGGLGEAGSFSGGYHIEPSRRIFGPYPEPLTMPMQRHVDYTPEFGRHSQDSALCATCHTLHTPITGAGPGARFPEQTPYLEWRASAYAIEGKQCQDCHMQRLDEPIKVSARPPWLEPRQPFWRHQFVGGNTFMLRALAENARTVEPHASPEILAATIARARDQLRRAARLELEGDRQGASLELRVRVVNLAGHKFPTGHPYRRAWLQVQVDDAGGRHLFESGVPDKHGNLPGIGTGYARHRDEITRPDEVQIYESVMGDAAGRRTYGLLSAVTYLKDNRIPPRGFPSRPPTPDIAVSGSAATDPNFNPDGSGSDRVTYRVDLGRARGPWTARVTLRYQAVPPEAVERLKSVDGEASRDFRRLYRRVDPTPEDVQQAVLTFE